MKIVLLLLTFNLFPITFGRYCFYYKAFLFVSWLLLPAIGFFYSEVLLIFLSHLIKSLFLIPFHKVFSIEWTETMRTVQERTHFG